MLKNSLCCDLITCCTGPAISHIKCRHDHTHMTVLSICKEVHKCSYNREIKKEFMCTYISLAYVIYPE